MLAAVVVLGALTGASYAASAVWGQTARSDSASPGVVVTFSYSGELVENAAGGARQGPTVAHWHGASAFLFGIGTQRGAPSDLVGDVQGVSNLEAPSVLRMEEAWLQQNLFDNHLSWLAGRYDLNSEFYRLQTASLFLNSSFGIGPEFAGSGVAGPSSAKSLSSRVPTPCLSRATADSASAAGSPNRTRESSRSVPGTTLPLSPTSPRQCRAVLRCATRAAAGHTWSGRRRYGLPALNGREPWPPSWSSAWAMGG